MRSTGKVVPRGCLPDRLGARGVVDAERLLPVLADIRMDPGHAFVRVAFDDRQDRAAALGSGGIRNPSGNVRSTTYRGILLLLSSATLARIDRRLERAEPHPPHYPRWPGSATYLGRASPSRSSGSRSPRRACERRACGGSPQTWWSTVRSESTSRSAISLLCSPSATSPSTSQLARRQAGRILPRRRTRPSGQAARSALAQAPRDDRRCRPRIEPPAAPPRPAATALPRPRRPTRAQPRRDSRGSATARLPAPSLRRAGARTAPPCASGGPRRARRAGATSASSPVSQGD